LDNTSNNSKDPDYWRSFKELKNDPEFQKAVRNEFQPSETKPPDLKTFSKVSRRKFLALLSASAAFAASGCSMYRDKGEIIPYNKKPEEVTIGVPNYYASTCTYCSNACGILVKTREGRPIKIDGNPEHPVNKGKICAQGQASIMNLYDPDKLKDPMFSDNRKDFKPVKWSDIDEKIAGELKKANGAGKEIAVLTHKIFSPTQKKLFDDFKAAYPSAKIYSYEVLGDAAKRSAWEKTYGTTTLPVIKWEDARIILSLESDFLCGEGHKIENAQGFTSKRDIMKSPDFNKLYAVEGDMTMTGMNADYRLILKTDALEEFALAVINELLSVKKISTYAGDAGIISAVSQYRLKDFASKYNMKQEILNELIDDLSKNQGGSIVLAGDKLPESVHITVNMLNEILGAGKLLNQESQNTDIIPLSLKAEIDNLLNDMNGGRLGAIIHWDTNPVFNFAPDYGYREALSKVPLVITMAEMPNETALAGNYILPVNHVLESWGDANTRAGIYSLQQPVIAPLYQNRQKEAIMLSWIKGSRDAYTEDIYHKYVMDNWEKTIAGEFNTSGVDFKKFWYASLHDGVVVSGRKTSAGMTLANESTGTTAKDTTNRVTINPNRIPPVVTEPQKKTVITPSKPFSPATFNSVTGRLKSNDEFTVLLQNSPTLGDGRWANNGWLQELPNPVTKVVWDNYGLISIGSAKALGVETDDLINIDIDGRKTTVPVFVNPGMADKVISINTGYGREAAGEIGTNIGHNVNGLMTRNPKISEGMFTNAKVSKAGGKYELVSTQEHQAIDLDPKLMNEAKIRMIIREGTLAEFKSNPKFVPKEEEVNFFPSINKDAQRYDKTENKWAMAIDLNKCTGCAECVVACNVENNIPVVGKDQVKVNREMHWLRIDRYFSGTPENPKSYFQPMLCQHCDFAPCENVCPVAATTHSPDGINTMAYNRCVGTRYCANNCPYKVRRYNYFNWRDRVGDAHYLKEPIDLMFNPEVTVRSRGVMEKCSFCLQRVMDEKQKATQERRKVNGNNITTACQDACSTNAIIFGDMYDKESEVSKYREHDLGYFVLEEIKVRPNVTYFAKLRNTTEKTQGALEKTSDKTDNKLPPKEQLEKPGEDKH
jgi:molybdopterin-containing oxidoreductase family iron-sulfur binding subunit